MLFSSILFIYLFLPAVLIGYYVIFRKNRKLQNAFLLFSSLFFYAWGEPKFVLVMLLSIVVNYIFGLLVDKSKSNNKSLAKTIIALTVVFNLAILFVFKYLNFSVSTLNALLKTNIFISNIALPIGISFFTFQAMSYVIDVYRGKGSVQKNILNVGLYIAFFPQLIAGPIVRYETVAYEIENRKETKEDFFDGFSRFIVGLAKKVLLANSFALVADNAFDSVAGGNNVTILLGWLGAICYTLQIYFDFSGYSDMAIGLGRMFGFHFLENFNHPYISTSITEFWRRWHISLGTWFRDYVYIPLGGSRVNKARLVLNLFVVWFFTGVWHGANWTFVVWGLMYFVLLTFEKLTGLHKNNNKIAKIPLWIYTMIFVVFGWVIFRADTLNSAIEYIRCMLGLNSNSLYDGAFIYQIKSIIIYLIFGVVFSVPIVSFVKKKVKENIVTNIISIVLLVSLFVLSVESIVGSSYNPFIYFNF